ncbi:hypothetical protein D3C86_2128270 [compost metagenome]
MRKSVRRTCSTASEGLPGTPAEPLESTWEIRVEPSEATAIAIAQATRMAQRKRTIQWPKAA